MEKGKKLRKVGIIISAVFILFTYVVLSDAGKENKIKLSTSHMQYKETKTGISIGKIVDQKLQGEGVKRYTNGAVYKGNFVDGRKDGKGRYTFANKTVLQGTFRNGQLQNGSVLINDKDGSFEAVIQHGKKTGEVKARLKNGDVYKGTVTAGKFNGTASIVYKDQDSYKGTLKDNLKSGQGTYQWTKEGNSYVGQWNQDKMNGEGIYYYSNHKYPYLKGRFQKNKPQGMCVYYKSSKVHYKTYWEKGICTKATY